ncbi:hypothetical protein [Pseudomonas bubulae]|uniref:hypothetical protein n=1 Tax=Pseudomonas bubulae TaxID=2316085 RepID=UPI0039A24E57
MQAHWTAPGTIVMVVQAWKKTLQRHFLRRQMLKVNPRKEFFRLGISEIRAELKSLGVETLWTMAAEAYEYRETIRIEQQIQENPVIEQQ